VSDLDSAVDNGRETPARGSVAQARAESDAAVEMNENEASRARRGRPPPALLPFVLSTRDLRRRRG
jgi:hypothetical protein